MRARNGFGALLVVSLVAGCGPHLVRVDLDARSVPLADIPSGTSCPVGGPEIDLDPPELERGVLGWPANTLVEREDGVLFPMHPRLSARAVADPCDPEGFRPRVVFLLRGTSTRAAWGDRLFTDSAVLDTFSVALEPGDLPAGALPVPPGASLDQRSGRFATVGIVQVGDESLTAWGERVTAALKLLDPYAMLSDTDRRTRDAAMEKAVWSGASGTGSGASRRLLVLQVGAKGTAACWNTPRCLYRIAIDQQARRFVALPEVRE
jgi:hypothetical protein